MSKKAKILLILSVAVALTLLTLFMFFPKQFLTAVFWIVGTIIVVFFLFALASGSNKRRKKRYHVIVEEEDDDFDLPRRRRIPPVAPVNPKGVEFITGAKSLRKQQQDAMKRTKKNLWG